MPFKLKYLQELSHYRIDNAIKYVLALNHSPLSLVLQIKEPQAFLGSLDFQLTPFKRLFDMMDSANEKSKDFSFNLKVLGKLLHGDDNEITGLNNESQPLIATRIFLKFKIYGHRYVSEHGNGNTCLHDVVLSCKGLRKELTGLLINNGADPNKVNDKNFVAAALYVLNILPKILIHFDWRNLVPEMPHYRKCLELIVTTMRYYPSSTLTVLKIISIYEDLNLNSEFFNYIYPWGDLDNSILHTACESHSFEVVRFMLEHGAQVNMLNADNWKPIHIAAERAMKAHTVDIEEIIIIIACLLLCSWRSKSPDSKYLTASYLVDLLINIDLTEKGLREKICRKIFRGGYFHPNEVTEDTLISLLNNRLNTMYCPEIKIESMIGEGAYGLVYKGTKEVGIASYKDVAIKLNTLNAGDCAMRKEAQILSTLKHPNIIRFICTLERDTFGIVMQYANGGTLADFIYDKATPKDDTCLYSFAKQMNCGLKYIHSSGYVHLDFKPVNILLDNSQKGNKARLLIADFGAAALLGEKRRYAVTTVPYCSPEGFDYEKPYLYSRDIYSFGVCLGELHTKQSPWTELLSISEEKIFRQIEDDVLANKRTNFSNTPMSLPVARLVRWCWKQEPSRRPSHDQIDEYIESAFNRH